MRVVMVSTPFRPSTTVKVVRMTRSITTRVRTPTANFQSFKV